MLKSHLPKMPTGRTVVVGAGKAAGAMAAEIDALWPGQIEGLVVTRYGHSAPCDRIKVVEAGHPDPDEAGMLAARQIIDLVTGLTENDLVICLLSGGGGIISLNANPSERGTRRCYNSEPCALE